MTQLDVRYGATPLGTLALESSGTLRFAYAESWLAAPDTFPVSLSIELRAEPYIGGAAHTFFTNLLPEGAARAAVCARLGISEGNDFALLRAIGGECAGAISVVAPGTPVPDPETYRYEVLSRARLQKLVAEPDQVALLIGGPAVRLSLAGAQEKLPVAVIDGTLRLPSEQAPSTHILKLPHSRYKHLLVNEAYVLGLATAMQLEVERVQLYAETEPPSLLVERYDRRAATGDDWPAVRLHQEDFCQALGFAPTTKYESEGGPTLAAIIALLQRSSSSPLVDVQRVIEWQAYNIVVGNSDGHAKNLSLLYEGGSIRLAPFYDLVSTRHYDGLHAGLGLRVGDRDKPDEIGRAQWQELAKAVGVSARFVIEVVEEICNRCSERIEVWTHTFRAQHGDHAILQTLPAAIRKRAKHVRKRLEQKS